MRALLICLVTVFCCVAVTQKENDSQIFITAAHIPESEFPGYQLIYKDEELDKAYYLDLNYTPNQLREGAIVNYGVVHSSSKQTFLVEPYDASIVTKGLSGSIVTDRLGNPVGFVSSLVTGGYLECVYY